MAKIKKIISNKAPARVCGLLMDAAATDAAGALELLQSNNNGLTFDEVEERRTQHGLNGAMHEKLPAWYVQLLSALINPFTGILFVLMLVSWFTDVILAGGGERSFRTIIVLGAMIGISTILRFWQEFRSTKAAEKLKSMICTTAAVLRQENGKFEEINIIELVPGDIISLSAGDMIPADIRVLTSKDLFISQAVLTGESLPVEKYDVSAAKEKITNLLDLDNVCFMGTNVVSGAATALVVATGNNTYFGGMARDIVGKRKLTSFDIGINKVSWVLIRFMFIMVPLVFFINGFTKGSWLEALLFAVSVAVGLTPEMLPMIVTANLARGAMAMAKRKTIVKRLNAIQNFGSMDILCTDKTGTLTQDKIVLEQHLDIYRNKDNQVLKFAYLNSFHQTGLRNLLDIAVLEHGEEEALAHLQDSYEKVDEIPFDFVRRRMSVIVRDKDGTNLLVCKGAVEEVLALCVRVDGNGEKFGGEDLFTEEMRQQARQTTRELNEEGLRVLAVAYRHMSVAKHVYSVADETEMVLAGFIAFLDPPKESASAAISALQEHGVQVKIITGDNEIVTRKICKVVGLTIENILLGKDVEEMDDAQLAEASEKTTIFS